MTPSLTAWTSPFRSVRNTWAPTAASRSSASGVGWPYSLPSRQEMTAALGFTAARKSFVDECLPPWCATFSTVEVKSVRWRSRASSVSGSLSPVKKNAVFP